MKRFVWRLQRVLDITEQREAALRHELLALAHQIIAVQQEILLRQAVVRGLLDDLGQRELLERLPQQLLVLTCTEAEERLLARLRARQAALEVARSAKTDQFLRVRSTRRTLERLREEARLDYLREMDRQEQAQLDEAFHISFARKSRPWAMGIPA
ncbi:MAG: hypothetical protein NT049_10125 [Planctomycetota bacterium]|nr:hypothetical protein [Planctomycetota bacterium]